MKSFKSILLLAFCLLAFWNSVDGASLQPNSVAIKDIPWTMYINMTVISGDITLNSPEWFVLVYGIDSGVPLNLPVTVPEIYRITYIEYNTLPVSSHNPIWNTECDFPSYYYGPETYVVVELYGYIPATMESVYVGGAQAMFSAVKQQPNTFNWTLVDNFGKSPGYLTLNWINGV